MSFRGSLTEGFLQRYLPFTWIGTLFFFLAALVLGFGIARIELAGLLWGSGFLLLFLYAFTGNHLVCFIIRRHLAKTLDAVDCKLPGRISPGEQRMAEVSVDLPRFSVPGFQIRLLYRLFRDDGASIRLESPLPLGRSKQQVGFLAEKRGLYRSSTAFLEAGDILGFTRRLLPVPQPEQVRVFPRLYTLEQWLEQLDLGGDASKVLKRRVRSDELLEVRKYFPGDDQRKINWKIYAHLGELLVRIGEETPPPESRYLLVLDQGQTDAVPQELAGMYLDGLVESCASLANHLLLRGFQIMFTARGTGPPGAYSIEKRKELLSLLAELWWASGYGEALEVPAAEKLKVILLSSPGAASLEGTIRRLKALGWEISLYLKSLELRLPERAGRSLKSLLFVQEEKQAPPPPFMEKKLARFKDRLLADLAKYRGHPWRLRNVAPL